MFNSNIPPRRFQVGDIVKRVDRTPEGVVLATFVGKVIAIESSINKPYHRVDVRWENGSKSYREEDGLEPADQMRRQMLGSEIEAAKVALGKAWGLHRPLHNSELARSLRMGGRDPGASVQDWIKGKSTVSGPASVAIEMMLAGSMPPDPLDKIIAEMRDG